MAWSSLFALLLVGCAGHRAARIDEHAALFATLSPPDQQKVQQGLIDVGFRHELVYMALGRPSQVVRQPDTAANHQTWLYHNFVYAPTSAVNVAGIQPGARYEGRQVTSAPTRGGLTSTPRSGPTAVVNDAVAPVATLRVDLVDDVVVRIRLDP